MRPDREYINAELIMENRLWRKPSHHGDGFAQVRFGGGMLLSGKVAARNGVRTHVKRRGNGRGQTRSVKELDPLMV